MRTLTEAVRRCPTACSTPPAGLGRRRVERARDDAAATSGVQSSWTERRLRGARPAPLESSRRCRSRSDRDVKVYGGEQSQLFRHQVDLTGRGTFHCRNTQPCQRRLGPDRDRRRIARQDGDRARVPWARPWGAIRARHNPCHRVLAAAEKPAAFSAFGGSGHQAAADGVEGVQPTAERRLLRPCCRTQPPGCPGCSVQRYRSGWRSEKAAAQHAARKQTVGAALRQGDEADRLRWDRRFPRRNVFRCHAPAAPEVAVESKAETPVSPARLLGRRGRWRALVLVGDVEHLWTRGLAAAPRCTLDSSGESPQARWAVTSPAQRWRCRSWV